MPKSVDSMLKMSPFSFYLYFLLPCYMDSYHRIWQCNYVRAWIFPIPKLDTWICLLFLLFDAMNQKKISTLTWWKLEVEFFPLNPNEFLKCIPKLVTKFHAKNHPICNLLKRFMTHNSYDFLQNKRWKCWSTISEIILYHQLYW